MIAIKEIRIGNNLYFKSEITGEEKILEVDSVFFTDDFWIKNSRPIPLTEEWLLKFGFIKADDGYINRSFFLRNNFQYWSDTGVVNLVNVHQLQNLYFALTGEELQMK